MRAENLIAHAERGTIGRVSSRGALVRVERVHFGTVGERPSLNNGDEPLHGREDALGPQRRAPGPGRATGLSVSVPAAFANERSRQAMFLTTPPIAAGDFPVDLQ
jgi:hypothetical protein